MDKHLMENLREEQASQTKTTTLAAEALVPVVTRSRMLGRFCGHSLDAVPKFLVSLHKEIVVDFYADALTIRRVDQAVDTVLGFKASYEFIPNGET
ncbi:hypothetical protein Ciccas_011775 [Cichlidogyrus casuarinus]|uniref:Uncharacterized protein n=1 Tax=Cichlidogyrus casuarinus TaxID=1844966 RepID=A0ABD2PQ94_9PLAT